MSTIVTEFSFPANVSDVTSAEAKVKWSDTINQMIENGKIGDPTNRNDSPRPQFFNPRTTDKANDYAELKISWIAFPKLLKRDQDRWKKADDSRLVQDEYCEWSVERDSQNKLKSVHFTCEGPEYWSFLAKQDPNKLLALYQQFISPNVKKEDLFNSSGKYVPLNKWNNDTVNGAMHLIQRNNTLGAEVELAAGASMVRVKNGKVLEEQQALIACGQYGQAGRNSDPHIGSEVNSLSRKGGLVSLRDPVGLYFDFKEFNPVGWETPDGSDPKEFMKILRGDEEHPLRLVFEVPKEKGYVVGDITINDDPIEYGAQITDYLSVKLVGIAQNFNPQNIQQFGCVGEGALLSNESAPAKSSSSSSSKTHFKNTRA